MIMGGIATIKNSYNLGTVIGQSSSGNRAAGICPSPGGGTFSNCYNRGIITLGYAITGGSGQTDCYYLDQTYSVTDKSATALTVAQMKSSDFVTKLNTITTTTTTTDPETGDEVTTTTTTTQSAWVADTIGINEGYPILSWQAQ